MYISCDDAANDQTPRPIASFCPAAIALRSIQPEPSGIWGGNARLPVRILLILRTKAERPPRVVLQAGVGWSGQPSLGCCRRRCRCVAHWMKHDLCPPGLIRDESQID